jgi:hypothetical protein
MMEVGLTCCACALLLQGPDAELRRQVQRGRVQTPNYGEVILDVDPDQLQVRGAGAGARRRDACCLLVAAVLLAVADLSSCCTLQG